MRKVDEAILVSFGVQYREEHKGCLEKEQEAGMGQGKRAWIYCAIDAPEDRNGALKVSLNS